MPPKGWFDLWNDYIECDGNAVFHATEKKFTIPVAKENLRDIVSVFNKNNLTYWIGYGTLLGCIRDNNFIEHDRDIDICCYSHESKMILCAIKDLEKLGFKVIRAWKLRTVVSVIRGGVFIDLVMFNKKSNGRYQNASWVLTPVDLPIIKRDFLGIEIPIPRNYEKMLARWYGEDWRIPVKGIGATVGT